jgi:hypothetical protein
MSQIITIDDFAGYLNKSVMNTVAQQVVDAVNAYIERLTNRSFGEVKSVTEGYDLSRSIWLRHQDVTDVSTVSTGYPGQTQDTIDPGGYYVNPLGRLTFNIGVRRWALPATTRSTATGSKSPIATVLRTCPRK